MPVPVPDEQERELVAGCAAGDESALEALYRRHVGACLAHARRVVVDHDVAEDVVQEAFVDLWRHASRWDGQRLSVQGRLLVLTHRRSVDRVRSRRYRPVEELTVLAGLGERARQDLAALTPAEREVLVLAYWHGLTQDEIAQRTGTPLGTVRARTLGALRQLAHLLDGAGRSPDRRT